MLQLAASVCAHKLLTVEKICTLTETLEVDARTRPTCWNGPVQDLSPAPTALTRDIFEFLTVDSCSSYFSAICQNIHFSKT